jgi:hypothetical protein
MPGRGIPERGNYAALRKTIASAAALSNGADSP